MNFDLSDEQREIRATASELLGRRSGEEVWSELAELGWPGIAVGEQYGGQELGLIELCLLTEQLGYACASTPFLGTTLAALAIEGAGSEGQKEQWLPDLANGTRTGALALADDRALAPDVSADSVVVVVEIAPATRGRSSPVVDTRETTARATIHGGSGLELVEAIDSRRRYGRVTGELGEGVVLPGEVNSILDSAAVVVAAELLGICRRALEMTVDYAKERRQFGVPIGSFQAVQHGAAQMLRDVEATAVLTYQAAWVADRNPARLGIASAMAKAAASDAARTVASTAIQLHGGIGFTWEADLHWLFKRAQIDAVYLGSPTHHRARVITELASLV
jgi:alkylation response protein AidB-like acyl-CoA dehydrogenase